MPTRLRSVCLCLLPLLALASGLPASPPPPPPPLRPSIEAGVDYLLACQSEAGSWHSEYYGNLRSGAGISSLVLYGLAHVYGSGEAPAALAGCRAWLLQAAQAHGVVCAPDGSRDYPVYATALYLSAVRRLDVPLEDSLRVTLRGWLVAAQLCERQGWRPGEAEFGGWDFLAGAPGRNSAGSNISLGACVLEALGSGDSLSVARALRWAAGVQALPGDGGFCFTPAGSDPANKAGAAEQRGLSYGSATVDGLRLLGAAGLAADHPRVEAALGWLEQHATVAEVPGLRDDDPDRWSQALFYYYAAMLAKVFQQWPEEPRWAALARKWGASLALEIEARQESDGSWSNPEPNMREDDPLVATPLALIALAELERWRE